MLDSQISADPQVYAYASTAGMAVRALNHAISAGGYERPADVEAVINELFVVAQQLPQVFDQTFDWLTGELRDETITGPTGAAALALLATARNAHLMARSLAHAREAIGRIQPAIPAGV